MISFAKVILKRRRRRIFDFSVEESARTRSLIIVPNYWNSHSVSENNWHPAEKSYSLGFPKWRRSHGILRQVPVLLVRVGSWHVYHVWLPFFIIFPNLENSLRLDQFLHIHEEIATLDVDFCPLWDTDPWIFLGDSLAWNRRELMLVDWWVLLVGGLEQ